MELKVLSERERRNEGKKQPQQYKLGKEVRLKRGNVFERGEQGEGIKRAERMRKGSRG